MKVDYIVPMVFPDDERWQRNFLKVNRHYHKGHVRYRSWGTERLLIQLVKKNMPWLNDIIIILAQESQRQRWMDEEGVRIVYHREFIPDRFLPTFNSRAMEMFLKDIPNISEQFLYGNDDMFPISPLREKDFFVGDRPCLHMTEKPFPQSPNNFQQACLCGLNFVGKEFGRHFSDIWYKDGHSIAPILKSTCEHLWERGRKEIEASISPFREVFNFNQYIYSWWQFLACKYVDWMPEKVYTSVRKSVAEVAHDIEEAHGIVCVNDNECAEDIRKYASACVDALKKKLDT